MAFGDGLLVAKRRDDIVGQVGRPRASGESLRTASRGRPLRGRPLSSSSFCGTVGRPDTSPGVAAADDRRQLFAPLFELFDLRFGFVYPVSEFPIVNLLADGFDVVFEIVKLPFDALDFSGTLVDLVGGGVAVFVAAWTSSDRFQGLFEG